MNLNIKKFIVRNFLFKCTIAWGLGEGFKDRAGSAKTNNYT